MRRPLLALMPQEVTLLVQALQGGDVRAADVLFPTVYDELRDIAQRQLRGERRGHTLTPTALVHEVYARMVDQTRVAWQGRAHFCAVAAQAMRRVLVDHARSRRALKRGGEGEPLPLDAVRVAVDAQAAHIVALDEALTRLGALSERLARVVELRFFGGLTEEEAAEAMGVTARTVRRDWVKAKAWLYKELNPETT